MIRGSCLLLGVCLSLAAEAPLALPDWLLGASATRVRQILSRPKAVEIFYEDPATVAAVIAGFRDRLEAHGAPANPRADGMGMSIAADLELAPGKTIALVIKVRAGSGGSNVTIDGALKPPPASDPPPAAAREIPPDTEIPPLKPEWPDWLVPMPESRALGEMMQAKGKGCVYWTSDHPNRPCLFQKYHVPADPLHVWDFFKDLCNANGYGVAVGSHVTPQVWILGSKAGHQTGFSEGLIEAGRRTVKQAVTRPGSDDPNGWDYSYGRTVNVTIGGGKGSTDYSLVVTVDNGRN